MSRILAIEDSPAIALLLRRRLSMAGHSVEISPNGSSALKRLAAGATFDLVLTDVMMPDLDGIETTRRIKDLYPGLPVFLVTGQRLDPDHPGHADALFGKPIDFDLLLEKIDRLTGS